MWFTAIYLDGDTLASQLSLDGPNYQMMLWIKVGGNVEKKDSSVLSSMGNNNGLNESPKTKLAAALAVGYSQCNGGGKALHPIVGGWTAEVKRLKLFVVQVWSWQQQREVTVNWEQAILTSEVWTQRTRKQLGQADKWHMYSNTDKLMKTGNSLTTSVGEQRV